MQVFLHSKVYIYAPNQSATSQPFLKQKKTNKNILFSLLELLFFAPRSCPMSLSCFLNISFISFLSVNSDSCLLKTQSLKPLSGMTTFSSVPYVLQSQNVQLILYLPLIAPLISRLPFSLSRIWIFLKLKSRSCAGLSRSQQSLSANTFAIHVLRLWPQILSHCVSSCLLLSLFYLTSTSKCF